MARGNYTTYVNKYAHPNWSDGEVVERIPIPFLKKEEETDDGKPYEVPLKLLSEKLAKHKAFQSFRLLCLCGAGKLPDGTNVMTDWGNNKNRNLKQSNPNDYSLAWHIEWDGFRYYTGGDLSGDLTTQKYFNIEEPMVEYLHALKDDYQVDALKADHHGSTNNNYFKPEKGSPKSLFDYFKPETIVVSCNQKKKCPRAPFVINTNKFLNENNASDLLFVNDLVVPANITSLYNALNSVILDNAVYTNILLDKDKRQIISETVVNKKQDISQKGFLRKRLASVVLIHHLSNNISIDTAPHLKDMEKPTVINRNNYDIELHYGNYSGFTRKRSTFPDGIKIRTEYSEEEITKLKGYIITDRSNEIWELYQKNKDKTTKQFPSIQDFSDAGVIGDTLIDLFNLHYKRSQKRSMKYNSSQGIGQPQHLFEIADITQVSDEDIQTMTGVVDQDSKNYTLYHKEKSFLRNRNSAKKKKYF